MCHPACLLLLLFGLVYHPIQAANILLMPDQIKSHVAMFTAISEELVKRGHNTYTLLSDMVTVPDKLKTGSGKQVIRFRSKFGEKDFENYMDNITQVALSNHGSIKVLYAKVSKLVSDEMDALLLNNEELFSELQSLQLDLVIVDGFFMTKYKYLVPHRLGLPIVTVVDLVEPWVTRVPWLPSFVPLVLLPFSDNMSFTQRLQNLMAYVATYFAPFAPKVPSHIVTKYCEYGYIGSADDVVRRSLLWISTTDVTLDYPKPRMPNMIEAGGLTTRPAIPLSSHWLHILNSAPHGVVLVSFGSVASSFPRDIAQNLMQAFGGLQQTVIWRFKNTHNLDVPSNVYISDWLPQNDLLGHANIKVFVTHCGNNGQFEALYHGVPLVAMPIYTDQFYNAKRIVHKGYGIEVNIKSFTPPELINAIREVMENPSYSEHITRASLIFHDRPETPVERAVSGIEHVLRFGGEHLRSYAADMPLCTFLMLDMLVLLILLAFVHMLLLRCIISYLYSLMFKSTTQTHKLKEQ